MSLCGADAQNEGDASSTSRASPPQPDKPAASKTKAGKQDKQRGAPKKTATRKGQASGAKSAGSPAATTFVHSARPANLPPITPANVPVITYFTQDTKEWVRAGEVAHVTMQGTAGGQAAFRIASFPGAVAMREISPGQYVGSWTVQTTMPLALAAAAVTGELTVNGTPAVPLQTSRALSIDTTPPQVSNAAPALLQTVPTATPAITADFSDTGSGIDASSVRLIVNGRDLTGEANVTTERIVYKPIVPLSSGEQTVTVRVSDRAGNRVETSWRFTVTLK